MRDKLYVRRWLVVFAAVSVLIAGCAAADDVADGARPNIVLIMADDLGFSDLGCYGSEIDTPNLDRLADQGLRFTQFYNTGRCCPSRTSLLTGMWSHAAGMGWMTSRKGKSEAYRGQLRDDAPTIAEHLRAAGYGTAMVGKWHQSWGNSIDQGPNGSWPMQRGFDRFYGSMEGAKDYFKPKWLFDGGKEIKNFPKDYFYTTAISERAAKWVNEHDKQQPLFLYAAFYAPHFPLHAPEKTVEKYLDRYKVGWDVIRKQRFQKQLASGLILKGTALSPRNPDNPAWEDLADAQRDELTYRMAIYAAQVDELDQGVGRILDALDKSGRIDNTLIVFLSDNGAASTGGLMGRGKAADLNRSGTPYTSYGSGWANASNTPYRLYKKFSHEGGVRTPMIVSWPGRLKGEGGFSRQPCHIVDLTPTFIDVAGATPLKEINGKKTLPIHGRSVAGMFAGKQFKARPLYFEHEGNRGMRAGPWKLVARGKSSAWEVYNLDKDPAELNDLAKGQPDIKQRLVQEWERWADRHGVKY